MVVITGSFYTVGEVPPDALEAWYRERQNSSEENA
jgi:hypothetical protein